ncbi:hypothetical protein K435DRAFT_794802 [Dendrothele bispora CBS 962.96]|uniref:Uncharacterized protein n=1 Tax=Dendrothele bispora (strain CBS 962.96) TaxID=1314807 RepID=A0A4S8MB13_DENBC|nr:hypothetical protein K435DRAFT_794802 [Dendrothele bispora CBS 962.96]
MSANSFDSGSPHAREYYPNPQTPLPPNRSTFSSHFDSSANISPTVSRAYTPSVSRPVRNTDATHTSYQPDTPWNSESTHSLYQADSSSYSVPVSLTPSTTGSESPIIDVNLSSPECASTAATAASVIDPGTIDNFAHQFKLTKQQRTNLHGFVHLGSQNPPLTRPDLATRLFLLGTLYQSENENTRREQARQQGAKDYKGMLDDMKTRLSTGFEFTNEQLGAIRTFIQDKLFEKSRTTFCKIHLDCKDNMKREKVTLKITNIIGDSAREKKLWSKVSRIASSIRNQMRVEIYASITGHTRKTLQDFSFDSAVKYKREGRRRFAREHPDLRGLEDEKEKKRGSKGDDGADEILDPNDFSLDNEGNEPPNKRQRTSNEDKDRGSGKKHFWGEVDTWFEKQMKSRGDNFNTEGWQQYIQETVTLDIKLYSPSSSVDRDEIYQQGGFTATNSSLSIPASNSSSPSPGSSSFITGGTPSFFGLS